MSQARAAALAVQREHDEQAALIRWADLISRCRVDGQGPYPELAYLFAIPNGGWRLKRVAAQMKREGAKAGVPDLCLPVAVLRASPRVRHARTSVAYGALWIEMKTATGSATKVQRAWRDFLISHGQAYALCRSAEEGKQTLLDYLAGRLSDRFGESLTSTPTPSSPKRP